MSDYYTKLTDLGVKIISISLDDKKENWLKANKADGILWTSLWDTEGFKKRTSPHPLDLNSFPTTLLVDKTGKIVLYNPTIEEIVQLLL